MSLSLARTLSAAACAAALACAASPALADVQWVVTGTFADGGTLSGTFDIDVYGYLTNYDLTTTAGSVVTTGFEYTMLNSYWSDDTIYLVDAQPGYFGDLHLVFQDPIDVAVAVNPLVGGTNGTSSTYECVQSWSCYVPQGGATRYLTDGFASAGGPSVPEPAAWALMIAGFGLAGAALRRRRSALTAA